MPDRPYHHGDLPAALVAAGLDLAREQGPAGVVVRGVTRRAGVSATAAYRHFADRDTLLAAVAAACRNALADAMEAELTDLAPRPSRRRATARLLAVGAGYIRFAVAEPGLFRTAFSCGPPPGTQTPDRAHTVLSRALDDLAAAGGLPPHRRADAEIAAWAAVHGAATLLIDGAAGPPGADPQPVIDRVGAMVINGL